MLKRFLLIIAFLSVLSGCQVVAENSNQKQQSISPAPANTMKAVPAERTDKAYKGIPLVIYTLPEDSFKFERTTIPYYRNGEITTLPEVVFTQFAEGHQPWLGGGLDVVTATTSNLTGEDKPFMDPKLSYKKSGERTTESGIIIKEINNELISLYAPLIGTYEIELKSPPNTSILFISKITLVPNK